MTRILIDTNRYSDVIDGDAEALRIMSEADFVGVPFVVLAELHAGFRRGSRRSDNERFLRRFLDQSSVSILFADMQTVNVYADLAAQLKRQGTPIPQHDIWIAALSLEHGLTLYSRDKHFDQLPQLARI